MQIDFLQNYEINKLVLWIYDVNYSGAVSFSIDIVTKEGKTKNIYPNTLT